MVTPMSDRDRLKVAQLLLNLSGEDTIREVALMTLHAVLEGSVVDPVSINVFRLRSLNLASEAQGLMHKAASLGDTALKFEELAGLLESTGPGNGSVSKTDEGAEKPRKRQLV